MRKSAVFLVCFSITAVWSVCPAMATIVWSGNLLTNPGAETGDLTGWSTNDAVIVIASQFQDQTTGRVEQYSGEWFFNMCGASAGSGVTSRMLYQAIDLSSYGSDIDAGLGLIDASTYLQTENMPTDPAPGDYAQLSLFFFDTSSTQIGSATTGLVQTPNLTWFQNSLNSVAIPSGSRSVRLELLGEKHETTFINAFFDDAELKVGVIPEPATICLLGLGGLALLRKRR